MSPKQNGILESGFLEDVKPSLKLSVPIRLFNWFVDLVRPSFLSRSKLPRKALRRTAYLDGIRGIAAFIVYWQHHQLWAHASVDGPHIFENAFGYENRYYFASLPGMRLLFTGGHCAVAVFFILSGYVLSMKPLTLLHAGEFVKFGDNVASALFRRWLRLYIPIICTTFLYMTSWHALGIWTTSDRQSTYREELWNWYAEFKNFSFVFRMGGEIWFTYDVHVWSIPIEFRGSIIIYTALVAFSRATRNARLWCEVGLMFYFMYIVDGWFGSLFMAGMFLCDLDLLAVDDNLPQLFVKLEPHRKFIFYTLFTISIYLGGVPSNSLDIQVLRDSPGWKYLSVLKPQAVFDYKWFYLFWAATFLVVSIPRIHWLKSFFETPFCQYLGRIAFAFYLVHGPVLRILGDRLYVATGWSREIHAVGLPDWINIFPLSKAGPLGLEPSFLIPHLIIFPATLWMAEIATKLFDEPSVRFSQWAYRSTLAPAAK